MSTRHVRPIRIDGDIAFVQLTKGMEAIVDASDVHLIDQWNWYADVQSNGRVYARRNVSIGGRGGPKQAIFMHVAVAGAIPGMQIDHNDGSTLNNRRRNLRHSTRSQNIANSKLRVDNTVGFKGVYRRKNRWSAQITKNGERLYLGSFKTPKLAHQAYIEAAQTLFGEFARSS